MSKNKLIINGREIAISQETANSIEKQFQNKKAVRFDKVLDTFDGTLSDTKFDPEDFDVVNRLIEDGDIILYSAWDDGMSTFRYVFLQID